MIKVIIKEYLESNLAIRDIVVTIFNIPIYKYKKETSNYKARNLLSKEEPHIKILGFI